MCERDFATPDQPILINGANREVIVGEGDKLFSRTLQARKMNWIAVEKLTAPVRVEVKIRHRHEPASALLESISEDEVLATFDQPQRAVTPGQAAVFYEGDVVIGGGWIA